MGASLKITRQNGSIKYIPISYAYFQYPTNNSNWDANNAKAFEVFKPAYQSLLDIDEIPTGAFTENILVNEMEATMNVNTTADKLISTVQISLKSPNSGTMRFTRSKTKTADNVERWTISKDTQGCLLYNKNTKKLYMFYGFTNAKGISINNKPAYGDPSWEKPLFDGNKAYLSIYANPTVGTKYWLPYPTNQSGTYNFISMLELSSNFLNGTDLPTYPNDTDDPEGDNDDPTDPTAGDGDKTSDPVPIPTKPIIDVTNTGFVTLYNPDAITIRQLAHFMWSGDFTDLLKKMFSAPFDCLIGLKLIYAPITTGASQTIWLGNVESAVSAPKIIDQFTDFDCGTITLNGYFGSFLDYSPYTKVTIFLPFIGYKQLNVDEVMDSQIHLTYRIDAYSGACIAFIHVTKTIGSTTLSSVIYEFDGNCAMDIPFTSGDMSRYVAAILGTAASTAGAVVSMGAGAKLATQSTPITANDPWTKADFSNKQTVTGLSDLGNGSAELIGGKPQIQRGGSLAGANASMALKLPYLIIERPIQQMPSDYANFIGIPLNMTKKLSQVSGFTVVSQIFMASSQATDDELTMIDTLLRQGVII